MPGNKRYLISEFCCEEKEEKDIAICQNSALRLVVQLGLMFASAEADALGVDPSAQGLLEGMGLDGDTLAPMETDEPTATDPKAKSKLTPAMATRIKQIKPLLSGQWQCSSVPPFYKSPIAVMLVELEWCLCLTCQHVSFRTVLLQINRYWLLKLNLALRLLA